LQTQESVKQSNVYISFTYSQNLILAHTNDIHIKLNNIYLLPI